MNEPVLVLNANYEPLNVCTTRRALGLLQTGKARMLLDGRGYIRTVRTSYPRPSIVRLGYMIKRPRPRVRLTKREIFRRDDYVCQYCGSRSTSLTIDHVVPRHRGGGRLAAIQACGDGVGLERKDVSAFNGDLLRALASGAAHDDPGRPVPARLPGLRLNIKKLIQ